eukprot:CAMPEP_0170562988 /NCGR_PEP_ID=MMETSP0211-20121228/63539_1 /TAXON_ID=311385 /ORGANISM="Pseudokeronopsis sp., Strain OXSARD2" /LENGTH=105 /DNA_ID=CAMNT_0010880595 /DNA_START=280 /DNA_END=594 /DNA_ORIENTATION=-
MIKAAAFVDMMNTSQLDQSYYRIRNPKRKMAQDVDFAVKELVCQLQEANINLDISKIKDFIFEIKNYPDYENGREVNRVINLRLSGNQLMIRTGGGYYDFLEFLQ